MKKNGLVVGFITPSVSHHISQIIWKGVYSECRKRGVQIVCFSGGYLKDVSTSPNPANITYDFATPDTVDGIIVYGGALGQFCTDLEMAQFCHKYAPIPIVNIATSLPNVTSVIVDNYTGMYKAVSHLIEHHGHSNIAFIKGPEPHQEAEIRYQAYKDALVNHNLPLRDDFVAPGKFSIYSGLDAVKYFIDEKQFDLDAIVAVDDDTAMGVIKGLTARGINVPKDIAIIGFDDFELARAFTPSLTTVRQPILQEGRVAASLVLDLIDGKNVPLEYSIPTEMIVRNSCGCEEEALQYINTSFLERSSALVNLSENEDEIVKLLYQEGRHYFPKIPKQWHKTTLASLKKTLITQDGSHFLDHIAVLTTEHHDDSLFYTEFHNFLSSLRNLTINVTPFESHNNIENIFHKARLVISKEAERYEIANTLKEVHLFSDLTVINENLNSIVTYTEMKKRLVRDMRKVGIEACFISLYTDPLHPINEARLFLAFDHQVVYDTENKDILFPSPAIFPDEYSDKTVFRVMDDSVLIIEPIFFREDHIGFAVLKTKPDKAQVCDYLISQISSMLNRIRLVEERKERNLELENSLTELKRTQKQLIESEKMASLGNLVAGLAHEINTPLGTCITSSSFLIECVNAISLFFDRSELETQEKEKISIYVNNSLQLSQSILRNLTRVADLVRQFKNVAVEQSDNISRTFYIKKYIQEIIVSLGTKLKPLNVVTRVEGDEKLSITSYPSVFFQSVTHFIMNSIIHGFDSERENQIDISIETTNKEFILSYKDNGRGMGEEDRKKCFEPFYTTSRGKGHSGLGLHIVYNLVTQKLGGRISCTSSEGEGAEFLLTIPLKRL